MKSKLCQVIAVVAGKKTQATKVLTEIYHRIQKADLFTGLTRTYQPKDEEGERLPPESKVVQAKVKDLIAEAAKVVGEMYDVVATQDYANCTASADVVLADGTIVLKNVPVTHLLFLEKQLVDLQTFISKLPTLDPAEVWTYDDRADCYATSPSETTRTRKIPKAFVKYEATKEHPAQVDVFNEDVLVGYWKAIKFSGAIPAKEKNNMAERARLLHEAVIKAREQANSHEVTVVRNGETVLGFVFGNSAV